MPVSWRYSAGRKLFSYKFNIPTGVHAEIHFPILPDKMVLVMNGQSFIKSVVAGSGVSVAGRWIIVENVTGECKGTIK